jgi:hypothetical protein
MGLLTQICSDLDQGWKEHAQWRLDRYLPRWRFTRVAKGFRDFLGAANGVRAYVRDAGRGVWFRVPNS